MSRELATGVVLTLVGVGLLVAGGYTVYDAHQLTSSAEEVDAVVVDSRLDDIANREDEDKRYAPEVTYEYEYDGEAYTSDNVYPSWHEPGMSESAARSVVREHDEGETVTTHVTPDEPSEAYLIERSILVLREALGAAGVGALILVLLGASGVSRVLGVDLPFSGE